MEKQKTRPVQNPGKIKDGAAWKGKSKRGKHTVTFRGFYNSGARHKAVEYPCIQEAVRATRAMLNLMCRERIYDVSIRRRESMVYLECLSASGGFREHVMDRFMKRD